LLRFREVSNDLALSPGGDRTIAPKRRKNLFVPKVLALIEREGDGYVSLCPELDIASQGETIESARDNLREALELFFKCASAEEIKQRLRDEIFITHVDVTVA
jgi:predicted RNase H-like HicB family nuclease